jgi:16S rRNA (guanine966-N2)-methyltransferase
MAREELMRIIAGKAKGRRLSTPKRGTRPMTGRARESVFAVLGERIVDAAVLDLYAGSGSLGLEALSRGAASAVFVERSPAAIGCLNENIASVGLGGTARSGDVAKVIGRIEGPFDVVFVDPPYADDDSDVAQVLARLASILASDGVIVVHRQGSGVPHPPDFLTSVDERRYGDAVVTLMERSPT